MKATSSILQVFWRWIDAVASTVHAMLERFSSRPVIKLFENEAGRLVLQFNATAGSSSPTSPTIQIIDGRLDPNGSEILAAALPNSRLEITLQPERFLFRAIELPVRATEFLNDIVRSQIDRLTPWNATDAAFGWRKSTDNAADRMVITIAASALTQIMPYVQAFAGTRPHSIAVFAVPRESGASMSPIRVWEERIQKTLDARRIRQALVILLATAAISVGAAIVASAVVVANLNAQQTELARQIAIARTTASAALADAAGSAAAVQRKLEQRKHEVPLTVMVLETLSRILPEHTYVTELRVEGDKFRMVGVTHDAPSLIGVIEQSGQFSQATFFAPTTQSASASGENFHIETNIRPMTSAHP